MKLTLEGGLPFGASSMSQSGDLQNKSGLDEDKSGVGLAWRCNTTLEMCDQTSPLLAITADQPRFQDPGPL